MKEEFERARRGETFDGHLARGVHGHHGHRRKGRARGHVHHHARSPRAELRQHGLRHFHHAEGVGLSGAGRWGVAYSPFGHPSFCAVLQGGCRLAVDGQRSFTLEAGDFVLLPATPGFTISGFEPVRPVRLDPKVTAARVGDVRHGTRSGPPDVRLLGGWFVFDSPDAALLVSLLPAAVHVRDAKRLSVLVRLVDEESSERR